MSLCSDCSERLRGSPAEVFLWKLVLKKMQQVYKREATFSLLWKVNVPSVICKSTTKEVLVRKQYNRKIEGKRNRSYDGKKIFIARKYARRNKWPLS